MIMRIRRRRGSKHGWNEKRNVVVRVMKHRVSLSDEEIDIIIEALESADFYSDDENFYKKLEKLRRKLKRLDEEWIWRSRAGRFGAFKMKENMKERIMKEVFGV